MKSADDILSVLPDDLEGRTIVGYISDENSQYLLLDDGRAISVSADPINDEYGLFVQVLRWKQPQALDASVSCDDKGSRIH